MGRCAGVRYRRGTNDPRLRRSVLRPIDGTTRWTGADHRERGRLRHRKSRRTQGAGEMFDWAQLRGHERSRFVSRCGRLRGDNPRYSRKQKLELIETPERDRSIKREGMRQIASAFLGYTVPKSRGREENVNDI